MDKYYFVDLLAGGKDYGIGECKLQESKLDSGLRRNDEYSEDYVDPDVLEIFEEAANY